MLLAAVTLGVFSQTTALLTFLLYPLLLLVLLRMGLGWAAMATLFVAAVGGWCTVRGMGPFAMFDSLSPLEPSVTLQIFIAAGMFMIYTVSVVLESQKTTERRLREIVALHALVTENSRDAIILSDFESHRSYVSSAMQHMSGWTPEEFAGMKSLDLLHPEDRGPVEAVLHELRSGAEGAVIECRVRRRDWNYIWVEASLRVVRARRSGATTGLLNVVRDITERKQAEKRLQDAYHAVEALAITDGLTGLANRRQFDRCLTNEWRRGMRDRKPLSLLLIDADLFKSYNDMYGHLRGDSCLKQIAEAAQDVVMRPCDLVARFGGEEFAVILPDTRNEGAMKVANEICNALRSRKLQHKDNPLGIITISVGCATMTPQLGHSCSSLIELADGALYRAKRSGRNQVCNDQPSATESAPMEGLLLEAISRKMA
jgi:diguanylate cyclase (GGDEF)-like protein/PAS domain S-box-containing protein